MVDEQKPWNIWDAIDANADAAYQEQQARYAERERLLAERTGEKAVTVEMGEHTATLPRVVEAGSTGEQDGANAGG